LYNYTRVEKGINVLNPTTDRVKVLVDYEINKYTMLIMAEYTVDHAVISKVFETEEVFYVLLKPMEIIERSCAYFGSSYKGRKEGTKRMISISHKAPIAISATNQIFVFPTTSSKKNECTWISHQHVNHFRGGRFNRTIVRFSNELEIELDISKGSFENQLYRTAHLRAIFEERIKCPSKPKKNYTLIPNQEINTYIKNVLVSEDYHQV
jgi:competence protein ComK